MRSEKIKVLPKKKPKSVVQKGFKKTPQISSVSRRLDFKSTRKMTTIALIFIAIVLGLLIVRHSLEISAFQYLATAILLGAALTWVSPSPRASARPSLIEAPSYLPQLDGLRFFAFILVYVHHSPPGFQSPFVGRIHELGWSGVELFFALSAFLFFFLLFKEHASTNRISIPRFYIRRILRIWPLYFFYFFWVIDFQPSRITERMHYFLCFIENFKIHLDGQYNPDFPFQHLWTISYEEQVYLLMPWLAWASAILVKRGRSLLVGIGFIALASLSIYYRHCGLILGQWKHLSIWVLPYLRPETMFAGCLAAVLMASPIYRRIPSIAYAVVAISALSLIYFLRQAHGETYLDLRPTSSLTVYAVLALGFGSLILWLLSSKSWLSHFLSWRPLAFLGKISYGLYVWHYALIPISNAHWAPWVAATLNRENTWALRFWVALIGIIGVSVASYYLLEFPFLALKKLVTKVPSRPL